MANTGLILERHKTLQCGARIIPLHAPARQVLGDLPRATDKPCVIVGQSQGQYLGKLQKTCRHVRKAVSLDDGHSHDFLYAFAPVARVLKALELRFCVAA